MMDQRRRLLVAELGFAGCSMPWYDRALWALRTWLDSWPGIGRVAVGMHRQGCDLQQRGWRATFYTTGMEHSPTSTTGTARERTAWRAAQRAAWDALKTGKRADVESCERNRFWSVSRNSDSPEGVNHLEVICAPVLHP